MIEDFKDIFKSLNYKNFRIFFFAQMISLMGSWIQSVAQSWLLWRLTNSQPLLGYLGFAQMFPVFIFGLLGGVLADKFERKRLIIFTQSLALLQATFFAIFIFFDLITPFYIFLFATILGVINAFDMTSRQTFLSDMVDLKDVGNAIALNSLLFNIARVVAPPIGGFIIAVLGEGICFIINAVSFLFVLIALYFIKIDKKEKGCNLKGENSFKATLIYFKNNSLQRNVLFTIVLISFFVLPYGYFLPYFADAILGGKAQLLGSLMSSAGLGAMLGALYMAKKVNVEKLPRRLALSAICLSISLLIFLFSKTVFISLELIFFAGLFTMVSASCANIYLQTTSPIAIRGKVISFYVTSFIGFPPIGGLLIGFLTKYFEAKLILMTFSLMALIISFFFYGFQAKERCDGF